MLTTLYSFSTGTTAGYHETGWLTHGSDLSAYAGQRVRLYFLEVIPETFTGPGQIEFDGIAIGSGPVPPSPTPTPTATPTPTPTPTPCSPTFTVNDNGDASDASPGDGVCATAGGVCTLRAAIEEANSPFSCGTININFNNVTSPISLATRLPDIVHNLNINGPGANQLTVQRSPVGGTPNIRVFAIQNVTVNISGITISNGKLIQEDGGFGAGLVNSGTLTLTNTIVTGNTTVNGFAVVNSGEGALTMINSTVSGNTGGGVINDGVLTLIGSTVSGNSISGGGSGINNSGTMTMTNSTVTGNTVNGSSDGGAGILNNVGARATVMNSTLTGNSADAVQSGGGGVYNFGTLYLTNSTVSGNSALNGSGGGILNYNLNNAILTVTNSTVTGNRAARGGGIDEGGALVNIGNTIVANNTGTNGGPDLLGAFNSQDYNLIGNTSGASFVGSTAHNITNMSAGLDSLANNGGPTLTHALVFGSPAIDAATDVTTLNGAIDNLVTTINLTDVTAFPAGIGFAIQIDNEQMIVAGKSSNTLTVIRAANGTTAAAHNNGAGVNPAFDQRGSGFPRVVNGRSDIGSFELQTPGPTPNTDTNPKSDSYANANSVTYANANPKANTNTDADTNADADTANNSIQLVCLLNQRRRWSRDNHGDTHG